MGVLKKDEKFLRRYFAALVLPSFFGIILTIIGLITY